MNVKHFSLYMYDLATFGTEYDLMCLLNDYITTANVSTSKYGGQGADDRAQVSVLVMSFGTRVRSTVRGLSSPSIKMTTSAIHLTQRRVES